MSVEIAPEAAPADASGLLLRNIRESFKFHLPCLSQNKPICSSLLRSETTRATFGATFGAYFKENYDFYFAWGQNPLSRCAPAHFAATLPLPFLVLAAFGCASLNAPKAEAACVGGSKSACRASAAQSATYARAGCFALGLLCLPAAVPVGYAGCTGSCLLGVTAALTLEEIACDQNNPCP
ncbi:hypothetical protein [Abditibacterium utsteinense]|uniref:hypothetical protein n=1 Tax=Abditibacterium utsteinense TaxID=1960156 RepID=UPI000F498CE4|nr:hypothetical protein [Abditibacterium utsteinense]